MTDKRKTKRRNVYIERWEVLGGGAQVEEENKGWPGAPDLNHRVRRAKGMHIRQ